MEKLRLEIDDLRVESFEAEAAPAERGTVRGHIPDTLQPWCPPSADAYCTYGHHCTQADYTCGGVGCGTYEGPYCVRWTDPAAPTCNPDCWAA